MENKLSKHPWVLGLCGKRDSGKDTVGDLLAELLPERTSMSARSWAFAHKLRLVCSDIYDVPYDHFVDRELKDLVIPRLGMSPRGLLKHEGQNARRVDPDAWVRPVRESIANKSLPFVHLVTDVRMLNEQQMIHDFQGVLIRVDRPGLPDDPHETEQVHLLSPQLVVQNSGSLGDLRLTVHQLVPEILRVLGIL